MAAGKFTFAQHAKNERFCINTTPFNNYCLKHVTPKNKTKKGKIKFLQ